MGFMIGNVVCTVLSPNPYKRMVKVMTTNHVAPNLVARQFKKHSLRRILLIDITYLKRTGDEFTFLSVIVDAYVNQARHGFKIDSNTIIHSHQGTDCASCNTL